MAANNIFFFPVCAEAPDASTLFEHRLQWAALYDQVPLHYAHRLFAGVEHRDDLAHGDSREVSIHPLLVRHDLRCAFSNFHTGVDGSHQDALSADVGLYGGS